MLDNPSPVEDDKEVEGEVTVTLTFNFKDSFPIEWDEEKINDWIKHNLSDYIQSDLKNIEDIEITY